MKSVDRDHEKVYNIIINQIQGKRNKSPIKENRKMNTVTVLEPKVGIEAKTQEKVVKLLTKQLKRVQKHTGFRTLLQQIHSYEDKAVFTDSIICLQLPADFTDKHIALNTLTKKEIEKGQQVIDPETVTYPETDRLFYSENQLEEMAQFEYDIVEALKELKELKKITREPTKREKLDKAIRINQKTGKFDYCKSYSEDSKEKLLPDYGVLIQADNLINSLSVMKELGDKKVTFYLHKEKFYLPIAIHSESVKGLVGAIRYK